LSNTSFVFFETTATRFVFHLTAKQSTHQNNRAESHHHQKRRFVEKKLCAKKKKGNWCLCFLIQRICLTKVLGFVFSSKLFLSMSTSLSLVGLLTLTFCVIDSQFSVFQVKSLLDSSINRSFFSKFNVTKTTGTSSVRLFNDAGRLNFTTRFK